MAVIVESRRYYADAREGGELWDESKSATEAISLWGMKWWIMSEPLRDEFTGGWTFELERRQPMDDH